MKKVSAKVWLPVLTVAWGIITIGLGFVTNYASFLAVRAILGLAEGGLLPGFVLYLSHLYNRGELALRIGIFYTAASLSGAFGGMHHLDFVPFASRAVSNPMTYRPACAGPIRYWQAWCYSAELAMDSCP